TGLPGVDLDGDGLIEVDMNRNKFLDVDFDNDGKPDDVLPDQNGDGVPEIDLAKDGFPDFGYLPEKWAKDTTRLFSKWAPPSGGAALAYFEVGLGVTNLSNDITAQMVPGGWFS